MSDRPWMPLYVADYLADTRRLSVAEHGAYLLLIMEYWRFDGLPDSDTELARIALMTDEQWQTARPALVRLFQPGWKHKRIDAELAKWKAKHARRVEAGRQGGIASAMLKQTPEQTPSNVQASSSENTVPKKLDASSDAPSAPMDERTKLFKIGLPTTIRLTGKKDDACRKLIGSWVKKSGNDYRAVNRVIEDADDAKPIDPVAWIEAHFRPRGPPERGPNMAMIAVELSREREARERDNQSNEDSEAAGTIEPNFSPRNQRGDERGHDRQWGSSSASRQGPEPRHTTDGGGKVIDLVAQPRRTG